MTGIVILCCKRDERLLRLAVEGIRRLGDWPIVVMNDEGYPAKTALPQVPYRRHHRKGWARGIIEGLNRAADMLPECSHLFKHDADGILLDRSILDTLPDTYGMGFSRGGSRYWFGLGYLLSREAIRDLAASDVCGDREDMEISGWVTENPRTFTIPGAFGVVDGHPIRQDAKMLHFGQFPNDPKRTRAEQEMKKFLAVSNPLCH